MTVALDSLIGLRDQIARREVTPLEAVEAALARIGEWNPRLNAFLTVSAEEARAAARGAEDRLGAGGELPPLLGVPIAVKDAEATAGIRTTFGSAVFRDHVPDRDTIHVERLKAAGAIVVGKTNTPEFTLLGETTNLLGPDCRNPWDLGLTPGGSSGGSAAAVAAGIVPLATGTDTAGSITIPAAFCGVFGFKPTHRAIPVWPNWDDWPSLYDVGPLVNSVRDAALALAVTIGYDSRDPFARRDDPADFLLRLDQPPAPLRIGFVTARPMQPVEPSCRQAVERTASVLSDLGHKLEPVGTELPAAAEAAEVIGCAYEHAARGHLLDVRGAELHPETRAILERGRALAPESRAWAQQRRDEIRAVFADLFGRFDILLTPATACPAFPLRTPPDRIDGQLVPADWTGFSPFNMYASLAGLPAASMPVGLSADARPLGVLAIAGLGRDGLLLRLCRQVEAAGAWIPAGKAGQKACKPGAPAPLPCARPDEKL